jgi:hypothetical protein
MSATRPPTPQPTRLGGFHPGWYGAVMGTAIVGIVGYRNPGQLAGLGQAAQAVGVLMVGRSALLAVVLGIPCIARWLRYPDAARAGRDRPPRRIPAPRPAALRPGLVRVHLTARRLHGEHPRPGPRVARRRDRGAGGGPVPGPRHCLDVRVGEHIACRSLRRGPAALKTPQGPVGPPRGSTVFKPTL